MKCQVGEVTRTDRMDDTKSSDQLIIKFQLPGKEEEPSYERKRKFSNVGIKKKKNRQRWPKLCNVDVKESLNFGVYTDTVTMVIETKVAFGSFNYNFQCDWLIEQSDNNLTSELIRGK